MSKHVSAVAVLMSGGELAATRSAIRRQLAALKSAHPYPAPELCPAPTRARIRNLRRALVRLGGEPYAPGWAPDLD